MLKKTLFSLCLFMWFSLSLFAQKATITGKVVDPKANESLPSVSVLIKGTTTGVMTDIDGNYSITVNDASKDVLVFSFIGYNNLEAPVGTRTVIDVNMESSSQALDEVVVVGYGVQKKVNVTGAITSIKTSELTSISASNLSNTLAGRAPGVNIVGNSGLAGASSSIRIRGGFGEPLYVIDGIVRDKAAFDALDANEVDNLSFLKDAATASIYGTRAGNGVVLVTTKSGTISKPTVNYQGSYTFSNPTMELMSKRFNATDELIYQNRVAEYKGLALPNGQREFDYFTDKNYDVNDYIWQTPWNHKHTMSLAGGTEKVTYYVMAGYRGEEGSYKNLSYDKFNLRSNVTAKVTDAIKIGLNLAANQQNSDRFYWPFTSDDNYAISDLYRCTFNWPRTYPFYTYVDGTPANEVTPYPVQTPMGSWQAWNVVDQVIGDRYIKTRERELNSTLTVDFDLKDLTQGLTAKFVGNYIGKDYSRKWYLTYQKNYVYSPKEPNGNRFIPAAPDPEKINVFTFSQNQEFLRYNTKINWSSQLNAFLNYDRTFGKHAVSGMLVWEQGQEGYTRTVSKLEAPLTDIDQGFVYSEDVSRRWSEAKEYEIGHSSWIGRFNYKFDERYIVEFSFRQDGNARFPKSKRWGFFPSASLAWRINNENFMKDISWLSNLKVRGSVGTTGNDLWTDDTGIPLFTFNQTYSNGGSYIFGDNKLYTGIVPNATPNPNVTWATSTTYNVGLDFGFFQNKLTGTIDAFKKVEKDVLRPRTVLLPYEYGRELAPENYAERSWRGFEISAMWQDNAAAGKIKYSVHANMGYSKDRWDVLDEDPIFRPGGNRENMSAIGNPIDRIGGLKSLGIIRSQAQVDELIAKGFKQYGRDPYVGGILFDDVSGDGYELGADGKIDDNDFQLLSTNAKPRINYGFGGSITWANITLDVHFQGVGMYDRMISNQEGAGMRQHGGTVRPYYPIWADDVWTPDNPNAKYPRVIGSSWYESGTGSSSFWIKNGSYLRLKSLNLGYDLPKSIISKVGLEKAQVFFNGTNLFFISQMREFHDPEQDFYDSYPLMKSFTFGIDITF